MLMLLSLLLFFLVWTSWNEHTKWIYNDVYDTYWLGDLCLTAQALTKRNPRICATIFTFWPIREMNNRIVVEFLLYVLLLGAPLLLLLFMLCCDSTHTSITNAGISLFSVRCVRCETQFKIHQRDGCSSLHLHGIRFLTATLHSTYVRNLFPSL